MDTLHNIKAFLATARTGSFSEAARQAGVAPSVITKRIDQLEWSIKGRLFQRSTRKLSLTDLGERYHADLQRLVHELDATLAGMARNEAPSTELEGHLRIKLPTTLGTLHLTPLLSDYLVQHPRLSLDLVFADRSVNPMEEGLDIAIGATPETYGRVADEPLCRLPRVLCAAPAYLARRGVPSHPRELVEHDALVYVTSGAQWAFDRPKGGRLNVQVRPRLTTNEGQALLAATCAGNGVAVIARYVAQPALDDGRLVPLLPGHGVPDVWLKALVPESRLPLPRVQALLQWLKQSLAQGLPAGLPSGPVRQ